MLPPSCNSNITEQISLVIQYRFKMGFIPCCYHKVVDMNTQTTLCSVFLVLVKYKTVISALLKSDRLQSLA